MLLLLFLTLSVGTVLARTSVVRDEIMSDDSHASEAMERAPPAAVRKSSGRTRAVGMVAKLGGRLGRRLNALRQPEWNL